MRHGATPRSTRRAAPDGGLAVLVRTAGPPVAVGVAPVPPRQRRAPSPGAVTVSTGQHRQAPARRRASREPQRTLQMVMSGLGALIVLSVCGLGGFFVVADERRGHGAEAAPHSPELDRISSRRVDAQPLTLQEVFPKPQIRLLPDAAPYAIRMTHIDTDCDIAVIGRLGRVLSDHACSQVVRASLTAPYGHY